MATRRCYPLCTAAILFSWCTTSPFSSVSDVENMRPTSRQPLVARGRHRERAATALSEAPQVLMIGSSVSPAAAAARMKEPTAFLARVPDGALSDTDADRNTAFFSALSGNASRQARAGASNVLPIDGVNHGPLMAHRRGHWDSG